MGIDARYLEASIKDIQMSKLYGPSSQKPMLDRLLETI
jgi:hypothetical protein